MTRVKFFQEYSLEVLEEAVNGFISANGISKASIQTTGWAIEDEIWHVITVTYEEAN